MKHARTLWLFVCVPLLHARALAQGIERISESAAGVPGNGFSDACRLTGDGRYVVYTSAASNLVAGDTNGRIDVFVHDRQTATTERVSLSTTGVQPNQDAQTASISEDGRFVTWDSSATNLAAGDGAFFFFDVYLRDRSTSTTTRVSSTAGGVAGDGNSAGSFLSADGRYIAYSSQATDIVAGDANVGPGSLAGWDVLVFDRVTGLTSRVDTDANGVQATFAARAAGISADGRYVAFSSEANDLVAGDTNFDLDMFIKDTQSGALVQLSLPQVSGFTAVFREPRFSADLGRLVYIQPVDALPGDVNSTWDACRFDLASGITSLLSVSAGGTQANAATEDVDISPDGRWVVFHTDATNLVTWDVNSFASDIFRRDLNSGTIELVSRSVNGTQSDGDCTKPVVANSGESAFIANGTTLAPAAPSIVTQVMVFDPTLALASDRFCFGDGSGTACPCALSAEPGAGCPNFVNGRGGRLDRFGSASVLDDQVTLVGSFFGATSLAIVFQGTDQLAGGMGLPFAHGLLCLGGSMLRIATITDGLGGFVLGEAIATGTPLSELGQIPASGGGVNYQAWYRNGAALCEERRINYTNGVHIDWVP